MLGEREALFARRPANLSKKMAMLSDHPQTAFGFIYAVALPVFYPRGPKMISKHPCIFDTSSRGDFVRVCNVLLCIFLGSDTLRTISKDDYRSALTDYHSF